REPLFGEQRGRGEPAHSQGAARQCLAAGDGPGGTVAVGFKGHRAYSAVNSSAYIKELVRGQQHLAVIDQRRSRCRLCRGARLAISGRLCFEKRTRLLQVGFGWWPAEGDQVRAADTSGVLGPRFVRDAAREAVGDGVCE